MAISLFSYVHPGAYIPDTGGAAETAAVISEVNRQKIIPSHGNLELLTGDAQTKGFIELRRWTTITFDFPMRSLPQLAVLDRCRFAKAWEVFQKVPFNEMLHDFPTFSQTILHAQSLMTKEDLSTFRPSDVSVNCYTEGNPPLTEPEAFAHFLISKGRTKELPFLRQFVDHFDTFHREVLEQPSLDPLASTQLWNNKCKEWIERYISTPCSHQLVIPSLKKLFKTVQTLMKQRKDGVEIASFIHTEWVRIHPFIEGNGRMARLLMNLVLGECGYPFLYFPSDTEYTNAVRAGLQDLSHFTKFLRKRVGKVAAITVLGKSCHQPQEQIDRWVEVWPLLEKMCSRPPIPKKTANQIAKAAARRKEAHPEQADHKQANAS